MLKPDLLYVLCLPSEPFYSTHSARHCLVYFANISVLPFPLAHGVPHSTVENVKSQSSRVHPSPHDSCPWGVFANILATRKTLFITRPAERYPAFTSVLFRKFGILTMPRYGISCSMSLLLLWTWQPFGARQTDKHHFKSVFL